MFICVLSIVFLELNHQLHRMFHLLTLDVALELGALGFLFELPSGVEEASRY